MEQHSYLHEVVGHEHHSSSHNVHARGRYAHIFQNLWRPLKKNFRKNLKLELAAAGRVWGIVQASVFGIFLFLFDFEVVVEVWSILRPILLTFLVGTYLTLLPVYVILPLLVLAFYAPKAIAPIMGVSVLGSLLAVFLL